jgi:hypothetical protein
MRYGPVPDLQIRIMHLDREGSPPPGLRLPSRQVVTEFQSDSSRTDSPVRIRHAQPASAVSVGPVHQVERGGAALMEGGAPAPGPRQIRALSQPVRAGGWPDNARLIG